MKANYKQCPQHWAQVTIFSNKSQKKDLKKRLKTKTRKFADDTKLFRVVQSKAG